MIIQKRITRVVCFLAVAMAATMKVTFGEHSGQVLLSTAGSQEPAAVCTEDRLKRLYRLIKDDHLYSRAWPILTA